jgi:hypothetical protein
MDELSAAQFRRRVDAHVVGTSLLEEKKLVVVLTP